MYKKRGFVVRSRFFPERKGQVTLFIIIGILLILALILVSVIKRETAIVKPEEISPPEEGKVEDVVRFCLARLGMDSLQLMGLQGGYIEVPAEISSDGSSYLKIAPFLGVPYWTVGEQVNIPSLSELESRLSANLQRQIHGCVFSQEEFLKSYDLVEKSDPKITTTISESKVTFNAAWDIEVRSKSGETIATLNQHEAALSIPLKKIHETAKRIVEQEISELKLEDLTQDLLALESPKLPLSGIELSCNRKVWKVNEAKQALQNLLRINLKQLKVAGTEMVEFPEELPYYQNHYLWNLGDDFSQSNINVVFNYENNFPLTFQVTPSAGELMKSTSGGGTKVEGVELPINFCVQTWKFTYDVIYPVLVKISDEKSGYTFQMAFTVHLIRNYPNRAAQVFARLPAANPQASNEDYCGEARIPMHVSTWELVENDQGVYDQQPLEGVKVSFTCLRYPCEIGKTDFNYAERGYGASLSANFPYCAGGILRGEKEGYKESWERVNTANGEQVDLFLTPLHPVQVSKFKVVKHQFNGAQQLPGEAEALEEGDLAVLKLKAFKNGKEFYKAEEVITLEEEMAKLQKVNFLAQADFTYALELQAFDGENIIGGYQSNWTVSWDQLKDAQEITFHLLTSKSQDEVFEILLGGSQYSSLVPAPEIK